jgi:phage terminase large subunit-like protein
MFHYDKTAASIAIAFFEYALVHVKGEWAHTRFTLQPWQRTLVGDLFGWKRRDGTRKYRRAYIEVPRKNGKSTIGAGIALYLLFADGEYGADVYSAAADRDQAAIVFETAKQMVELSPLLKPRAELFKRSIFCPENMGSYKVLSADAFTKHGLNPHGIIFDELHAQPNRDLWDVLNTGMGARRQPLMVMITTAGFDRTSICWEQRSYGLAVQQGRMDDPSFYTYISAADESDDWLDPKVWAKANPNLDVTVSSEYIATESARAVQSPAYQNTFRRLHLNQWTQQESRWLDMRAWDACNAPLGDLEGRVCYAGLDLASTTDIAALVLVFPPEAEDEPTWLLPFFWIPQANLVERSRRDRVPYAAWLRDGLVYATPGTVIDYDAILEQLKQLAARYRIGEIAFDRWGATRISTQLTDAGFTMVEFGQGYASLSAPTKELLRLVLGARISHGGNPVLRWMADNVTVEQDAAGNVKPSKGKSREKIDGIVACIMGLDRALRRAAVGSVYDQRGVLEI